MLSTDLGTPREFFLRGDHPNHLGAGRNQAAAATVPCRVKKTRDFFHQKCCFFMGFHMGKYGEI